MFNLLYKEFKLAAHPTLYIFMLPGALVIIPAYPYSTVFLYGCLAPFITFYNGRENHDVFFTALLPVKKKDVVKAKCMLFVIAQLEQLLISLPFAYLRTLFILDGNPVGMETNIAYYGFGLMIFAMVNFIFFTQFYKAAYQVGKAFILGMIPAVIGMVAIETLPHLEAAKWLDSMDPLMMIRQLPILLISILIYILSIATAYRIAAKRFEHVDL